MRASAPMTTGRAVAREMRSASPNLLEWPRGGLFGRRESGVGIVDSSMVSIFGFGTASGRN